MLFKKTAGRARLPFLVVALLVSAAGHASSSLIQKAQQDLVGGNAAAAFESLQAAEMDHAGDPEFDYWLGLTANRAGKSGHAVFALERVLAQKPRHAAARLELAVAYARLGQGDSARRELDTLDGMNPPEAAQKQIAELRRQLGLGDMAKRQEKRIGWVGLELGFDDNPGSRPDEFWGTAMESAESPYYQLSAGIRQRADIKADQKMYFSLFAQGRRHTETSSNPNEDAGQFDTNYLGGRAEWVKDRDGRREFAIAGDLGMLQLDGENYYNSMGVDAEWRHQRDERTRTLWTLGVRNMSFDADANDYLALKARAGIRYRASRTWALEGDFTLEQELASDRMGGDAIRAGVRGAANWSYRPTERLGFDLSYTYIEYSDDVIDIMKLPLASFARDDGRLTAAVNWDKTLSRLWQLRARAQHRNQSSSHFTYEHDQSSVSLSLTRYF